MRFDNALTATGNQAPAVTITVANIVGSVAYITLDAPNDRLYVADAGDVSILIYDNISTRTVSVAPSRTIAGAVHTTLFNPIDVAFDRVRNVLYVADEQDIIVFGSSALATGGDVAPARTLTTSFTGVVGAIFIDATNDRLYAADASANGVIAVYDNASTLTTGTPSPTRLITGTNTNLTFPVGIQVDGLGRLVVSNLGNKNIIPTIPPSITIYSSAAVAIGGNIAPVAQIAGSNTGILIPDQIVVDPSGTGTLYNADPSAARVAVFANLNAATGNVNTLPTRSITGTGLTAGQPLGVALDNTR
jgi:hypothetical protein